MLSDVADLLACPLCAGRFRLLPKVVRCEHGHSFDVARQGYVNLLPGGTRTGTADTAAMVAARQAFLAAGHYAPLAEVVADRAARALRRAGGAVPCRRVTAGRPAEQTATDRPQPVVLDAGTGTGYHLRAVLDRLAVPATGLALDISAGALRRAARAHPRIGAVGCDLWAPWPVRSSVASVILNVFAPRNAEQFRRVLRDDGTLIVVTPAPAHLAELVAEVGLVTVDTDKEGRVAAALGRHFAPVERSEHTFGLRLGRAEIRALVAMGPSARHLPPPVVGARTAALPEPLPVTAAFQVAAYQPL